MKIELVIAIIGLALVIALSNISFKLAHINQTIKTSSYDTQTLKQVNHDCKFFDEWQNNLACKKIDDREQTK